MSLGQGIVMTTEQGIHFATEQSIHLTTEQSIHLATEQSIHLVSRQGKQENTDGETTYKNTKRDNKHIISKEMLVI